MSNPAEILQGSCDKPKHEGPFIFRAIIMAYDPDQYEGADVVDWEGFYSTPEKAEAAIGLAQAKLAPEEDWRSDPSLLIPLGASVWMAPSGWEYVARIEKINFDEEVS